MEKERLVEIRNAAFNYALRIHESSGDINNFDLADILNESNIIYNWLINENISKSVINDDPNK